MFKIMVRYAARMSMLVVLSVGLAPSFRAAAEDFLSVLDDMPLAPGLTELSDQAANFDTPAGRIIDGLAQGTVDPRSVSAFYDQTLPALGWGRDGPGRFSRDQERLTVTVIPAAKGQVLVRFSVRPRDGTAHP